VRAKAQQHNKWGFDTTEFKPDGFLAVLKGIGAKPKAQIIKLTYWKGRSMERDYFHFFWQGDGVRIVTYYNPLTGMTPYGELSPGAINLAGYIGIEGEPAKVSKAARLIKRNAEYVKDEEPGQLGFIGFQTEVPGPY
jgi:hypothetical protein